MRNEDKRHTKEDITCHKCGFEGYYARSCYIPKYFVDLYQSSLKVKVLKTNLVNHTYLEVFDFSDKKNDIDNLIGNGDIHTN